MKNARIDRAVTNLTNKQSVRWQNDNLYKKSKNVVILLINFVYLQKSKNGNEFVKIKKLINCLNEMLIIRKSYASAMLI